MKKVLYKSSIRSLDKVRLERVNIFVDKIDEMFDPGHKSTQKDVHEELLLLLEHVPELLKLIKRMDEEYKMSYDAAEKAITLLQTKSREFRSKEVSWKQSHWSRNNDG